MELDEGIKKHQHGKMNTDTEAVPKPQLEKKDKQTVTERKPYHDLPVAGSTYASAASADPLTSENHPIPLASTSPIASASAPARKLNNTKTPQIPRTRPTLLGPFNFQTLIRDTMAGLPNVRQFLPFPSSFCI
jgi:hypothetical protein